MKVDSRLTRADAFPATATGTPGSILDGGLARCFLGELPQLLVSHRSGGMSAKPGSQRCLIQFTLANLLKCDDLFDL